MVEISSQRIPEVTIWSELGHWISRIKRIYGGRKSSCKIRHSPVYDLNDNCPYIKEDSPKQPKPLERRERPIDFWWVEVSIQDGGGEVKFDRSQGKDWRVSWLTVGLLSKSWGKVIRNQERPQKEKWRVKQTPRDSLSGTKCLNKEIIVLHIPGHWVKQQCVKHWSPSLLHSLCPEGLKFLFFTTLSLAQPWFERVMHTWF